MCHELYNIDNSESKFHAIVNQSIILDVNYAFSFV